MTASPQISSARFAVVGATGLVGETLLALLAEQGVPAAQVLALASAESAGRHVSYGATTLVVEAAGPAAMTGRDVVFFAATDGLAAELAPAAVEAGAFVIDKSATFRADASVPLVIPALNGHLLDAAPRLVSSPNCTTIGVAHVLGALARVAEIGRVTLTTLQSASGAGRRGLEALAVERAGREVADSPFAARLVDNVVPLVGALDAEGVSSEERKLCHELRRLLERPALEVDATCIRVPTAVGHTASLRVAVRLSLAAARAALVAAPPVEWIEGCPTPAAVVGTDRVLVGRLRSAANGDLLLVQCADNLRRGAATNALECAARLLSARA
ncbi:MAG: aspartate-semialdehyde dehydrogenase [Planctomycetota bacterium]